jgi:hypothetical protein
MSDELTSGERAYIEGTIDKLRVAGSKAPGLFEPPKFYHCVMLNTGHILYVDEATRDDIENHNPEVAWDSQDPKRFLRFRTVLGEEITINPLYIAAIFLSTPEFRRRYRQMSVMTAKESQEQFPAPLAPTPPPKA